ncbi:hypothetical protein, partial [Streptomyces sp. IBSBF 2394]|uniref:hypothetical protein n=1 Tax=Streptomyces sp. IBSBF 2394 TaxID=2903532 RepID=UPI002FDBBA56
CGAYAPDIDPHVGGSTGDLATRYANHLNANHRRPAAQDPTATPEPIENSEFTQVFQQLDDCEN